MNILFTIRNIDCGGGTERVGIRLANALCERGYNVHMVDYDSKAHKPFFPCHPKLHLWTILSHGGFERKMRWNFWYGAWKFRRYIKKHNIDVVIDIDYFNALWSAKLCHELGVKLISWDHYYYGYSRSGTSRYDKALSLSSKYADYMVTLNKGDRESYIRDGFFSADKVISIYNPLSFEVDHIIDHKRQKKVLALGRIDPIKGFDLLLKSWLEIEKEIEEWSLEIVCGYGDYKALEKEARELGCKRVICSPPTNDVKGKMTESAIFALSSRSEGFGLVITEAASCSVPCVAYNCSAGPREIITDGEDGFLVDPQNTEQFADKLLTLMRDDKLRAEMGRKAFENCQRFSMANIIGEWEKLIND